MKSLRKCITNNNGFTLTEVMVSVGLIGILAVVNMTMFSENMQSQRMASEQAAATRTFRAIAALLADPDVCSRFLGDENTEYGNGQPLPGAFVDISNNPRVEVEPNRVIRIPNGNVIMYQGDQSVATGPSGQTNKVFEGKLKIDRMFLESYRTGGTQDTVKLVILFMSATADFYANTTDRRYPQEMILNVVPNGGRIDDCNAAE